MHIIDIFIHFLRPLFTARAELHQPFTTVEMKISKLRNNKMEAGARDKFPILMKILLN
jgi:hypothetical protein